MKRLGLAALSASAIAYMWGSSKTLLFGLEPSALLAIFAVLLVVMCVLSSEKLRLTQSYWSILLVSTALILWALVVYTINGLGVPRRVFQMILALAISFAVYFLTDRMSKIWWLTSVLIFGAAVSALIGVGQFFRGGIFIDIWQRVQNPTEGAVRLMLGKQVAGLAAHTVMFSYHLAATLPLAIAVFLRAHNRRFVFRRITLLAAIVLIAAALVFTGIRAAVGGAVIGGVFALILVKCKSRCWWRHIVFASLVGLLLYVMIGRIYHPTRFLTMTDVSARVRLPMQATAIVYALHNPLGTGVYQLSSSEVDVDLDDPSLTELVFMHTPHNQFLNVLVYYGFPGFALLVLFYSILLKTLFITWRIACHSPTEDSRYIVAGLAGAMLGYLVNSMFHNAGPFVGDVFHWYFIGLVFSLHTIVTDEVKRKILDRVMPNV